MRPNQPCDHGKGLLLRHGVAAAFAFAGVLALAAIVTRLTATLALALVLPFASVLAFVSHLLDGCTCIQHLAGSRTGGLGCEGTGEKASECCTCDDVFVAHVCDVFGFGWPPGICLGHTRLSARFEDIPKFSNIFKRHPAQTPRSPGSKAGPQGLHQHLLLCRHPQDFGTNPRPARKASLRARVSSRSALSRMR